MNYYIFRNAKVSDLFEFCLAPVEQKNNSAENYICKVGEGVLKCVKSLHLILIC